MINNLVDWFINVIFRWGRLREAIFDEVHMYDSIDEAINEPTNNLSWQDSDGLWYGWYMDQKNNKYVFEDTGYESLIELWADRMENGRS